MKTNDKVWYACYGSNLKAKRFRSYIEGTVNEANGLPEKGCRDRSLWTDERIGTFKGQLYFAKRSSKWNNQGVAFIDRDADGTVIMRLYLITWEQYLEIKNQEGPSYKHRVDLGFADDGYPIYSFTSPDRLPSNPPSGKYLDVIKNALIDECGIPAETVKAYLDDALRN